MSCINVFIIDIAISHTTNVICSIIYFIKIRLLIQYKIIKNCMDKCKKNSIQPWIATILELVYLLAKSLNIKKKSLSSLKIKIVL